MGARKQVKAGLTGDKAGTPPPRAPQWQGRQATKQARPPPGTADTRRAGNAGASPPLSFPQRQGEPVPRGFSPGDARGAAPCIRKQKISPFPTGEGGRGSILPLRGRGAGNQAKGRVSRRQSRHAPRRVPLTPTAPATPRQAAPPGHTPHTAELTPYFYRQTIAIGKNMW